MKKQLKTGAALLVAAGALGLVGATPAHALVPACTTVGTIGVASPRPFSCTTTSGFTFTLNNPVTGFVNGDSLSFTSTSSTFTLGVLADQPWAPGTYALNYTIAAPTGKLLSTYSSSLTSSVSSSDAGNWSVNGANGTATATFAAPNAVNGNKTYAPQLASDTFASTLTVTGGVIQSVTSTVNVVDAPVNTPTPGPLPLLGAGAAFGFSRRLRNRVKLAA